jgi:hypothetical protein
VSGPLPTYAETRGGPDTQVIIDLERGGFGEILPSVMIFHLPLNFIGKLRVEIYQNLMLTNAMRHLYSSDLN